MHIRTAQPQDKPVIQELNNQVFEYDTAHDTFLKPDWPFSAEGEKYYTSLANGTYGTCFIAEDQETHSAVGYVAVSEKKFGYRTGKVLEIENIGVRPEHRSKGIGRALIQHVREYAKANGYDRLYVAAYWKNEKARAFYKSCGLNEIAVEFEGEI